MNLKLKIWRQKSANSEGRLADYEAKSISPDASFLEMLDLVNEDLLAKGESRSRSITTAAKASAAPAR
jgi:succinate dehydrogenase / fumarate reductase iron-sulfur subunit